SLTVVYSTTANGNGYQLDASTASDFSGTLFSSATVNSARNTLAFGNGPLSFNTTYFLRLGAIVSGVTSYNLTTPSTSTLANIPLTAASTFTFVGGSSVTAQWLSNGNPSGTLFVIDVA